jgi:hypothetical protein
LEQQYVEDSETPSGTVTTTEQLGRSLPHWQVVARRWLAVATERALGDCVQLSTRSALAVLGSVVALLVVIGLTLSVGNALLVAGVGVAMRIACERRMIRR